MLLPDGKALIMDAEQYRQTISRSIVIDLLARPVDKQHPTLAQEEPMQAQSNVEGSPNQLSRNPQKDISRKPSQANQKKPRQSSEISAHVDADREPLPAITSQLQIIEEEDRRKTPEPEEEQTDFIDLLDQAEFSDVTLIVEGGKQVHCHQVILASRSTYFEAIFTNEFSEKESRVVDLSRANISYEQLMRLLRHLYSDTAKVDSKHIFDILCVSSNLIF